MGLKHTLAQHVRDTLPEGAVNRVEDTYRKARIKVVSARYGHPARGLKVLAVTGTNGKTTTVNFLNEILKEAGFKTAMFSTAIIEINGKATINDLNVTVATTERMQLFFRDAKRAKVDYVLLEVTSHSLDQHKLDGVPIEGAIMTNLTQDHLDYHKTMERYAEAKGKLFANEPKFIVLNRDDAWFDFFDKYPAGSQKITYGEHRDAEAYIDHFKLYRKGSEATITIDHQTNLELATALPGEFNVYNMTAAAAMAYLLGVSLHDIQEGIANLEGVPGRFERISEGQNFDVIVDYAHTPDALEKLLTATKSITKHRVMLVFGATGDRDRAKRPLMGKIAATLADRIFLTDEESYNEDPAQIRSEVRAGIEDIKKASKLTEISDRREAIKKALSVARAGDTILVTGMGHEKYRICDGERQPWNDGDVIREILTELRDKNHQV